MSTHVDNVLVFGPTGGVGRATALEAKNRGAHVWLAMRDTNKAIPGLSLDEEGYTRIHADLSKPDTLKHAVQQSGATTAFVYTLFGSPDSMRSSFDALKEAGISYVSLLSSFIVKGDPHDEANHAGFIEKVHSQAEAALSDSGIKYAWIRPAYFDTNTFLYLDGIKKGQVDVLYPKVRLDYIAPEDIGAVCGAILTSPLAQSEIVYLCGPKLLAQEEAISVIADALGKEIQVKEVNEEEWKEGLQGKMPPGALDSVASTLRKSHEGHDSYPKELYEAASKNVEKYTGRDPTSLGDWVHMNKVAFT